MDPDIPLSSGLHRAAEIYDALKVTGHLRQHRLLTWRCRVKRCVLADVVACPEGTIVHRPKTKWSKGLAQQQGEPERQWPAITCFLSELLDARAERPVLYESIEVWCDHFFESAPLYTLLSDIDDALHHGGERDVLWPRN